MARPNGIPILRLLSLREHGHFLLHRKAVTWQDRVTLLMISACIFEGVIWGTAVYLLGARLAPDARIAATGLAAMLAAVLTVMIEVSLATLDLEGARERFRERDSGRSGTTRLLAALWMSVRVGHPFLVRMALVGAVWYGTQPALR